MINFQEIISWFNTIFKLSNEVQPVINQLRNGVKTKTLDGVQFIDFEGPSLSNIQQLNDILRANGVEEIDESLLEPSLIDIQDVLSRMQQDFTEDELARAIEGIIEPEQTPDFSLIEVDLADICAPSTTEETPEFSEKELIDAACDVIPPGPTDVTGIGSVPTTPPKEDLQLESSTLPDASDGAFSQLLDAARNTLESDIFPKNGPDCIAKMQEIVKNVQEKVNTYTDVKKKIQEVQLDYYYETIVNAYYDSFLNGYGDAEQLKKSPQLTDIQKKIAEIQKEYQSVRSRSDMQEKMEEVILSFSNQFDIEIDSGFLGLFQSSPIIKINKDKAPLSGKIKDIPDALVSYIDNAQKDPNNSSDAITEQAKKTEKELDEAFVSTVNNVKNYSFGFGFNWFLENEPIESDFSEFAKKQQESYDVLSKKYLDLKKQEEKAQSEIDNINSQISSELANMNCKSKEVPAKVEAGKDLGFKNVSKNPTIFDYSWWLKFSALATIVNLVPVHWPVGLLIPTPTGLIRIPFPIIWFPIFIAPTDKLIAVLFIGQCGILPCPYLFLQHFLPVPIGPFQSNNPYFAVAIGGPVNISSHEPLTAPFLPSFDLVFPALNAVLNSFRSGITADIDALITEVRNQLDQVQGSADRYLALSQRDIQAIIDNAKKQATQTLQSAKQTAEDAIKQAQVDGQRLIEDARQRYQDANVLSEVTLTITRGVQERINDAQRIIEDARRFATDIITNAQAQAAGLKKRAEDTVKAIIENGKQAYRQKLQEIQQLEDQYNKTLETLNDLIDRIKVPTIDLSAINLSALLSAYSLTLGSLKSLAADLSPKAIQFGFPTEISPQFSASLPIFKDELPPWERLSLLNIPFVLFLWKWCKSGKYVGGFLPESIVGPF